MAHNQVSLEDKLKPDVLKEIQSLGKTIKEAKNVTPNDDEKAAVDLDTTNDNTNQVADKQTSNHKPIEGQYSLKVMIERGEISPQDLKEKSYLTNKSDIKTNQGPSEQMK